MTQQKKSPSPLNVKELFTVVGRRMLGVGRVLKEHFTAFLDGCRPMEPHAMKVEKRPQLRAQPKAGQQLRR